jgi:hypothetical protein
VRAGDVIGVDFDNTIIDYDAVMRAVAVGRGLVPLDGPADKRAIRDLIRARPDGDIEWQRVQGEVYGPRIGEAVPMEGVGAFLRRCAGAGAIVHVVSHKTERAGYDPTDTNLRQAALQWLWEQSAFSPAGFALRPEAIRFADTRQEKIGHIRRLGCRVFIDDLREVFAEADFPADVVRILYDPTASAATAVDRVCRHWSQIEAYLFDDDA